MIFGKSYEEKHKIEQAKLEKLKGRVKVFAWYPVREYYGRWVWMQYVYKDVNVLKLNGTLYVSGIYYLTDKE